MATITIQDERRTIHETQELRAFLELFGIWYENWEVAGRISDKASDEEILRAYQPEIERLKQRGGFVTADVINVTPDTPNLDAMLNKFNKEHTHNEDEIRFTVAGRGVFHIHPPGGPVFAIEVQSGDLINVPRGTRHWFDLCAERTIRCIRLFKEISGWTPHYISEGVHEEYAPVCWGHNYLPPAGESPGMIKP
jgi:1,2-dihydroxy-3-keto-5-methylthiopentene dioxygenase